MSVNASSFTVTRKFLALLLHARKSYAPFENMPIGEGCVPGEFRPRFRFVQQTPILLVTVNLARHDGRGKRVRL